MTSDCQRPSVGPSEGARPDPHLVSSPRQSAAHGGPPSALRENINQLVEQQRAMERKQSWQERAAAGISYLAGNMAFVWFHVVWFGAWILLNAGPLRRYGGFDPFPFGLLTMAVSLEAIFLSTFLLVTQNRMQAAADRRAELDLHINLLAERETTLILLKLSRIEEKLGIEVERREARLSDELTQPTNLADVVDQLDRVRPDTPPGRADR